MLDILSRVELIHRPRLLVSAARFGVQDYRRTVHLPRILQTERMIGPVQALTLLVEMEEALEEQRQSDDGRYSLTRHVDLLIAMMAEARMLSASRTPLP